MPVGLYSYYCGETVFKNQFQIGWRLFEYAKQSASAPAHCRINGSKLIELLLYACNFRMVRYYAFLEIVYKQVFPCFDWLADNVFTAYCRRFRRDVGECLFCADFYLWFYQCKMYWLRSRFIGVSISPIPVA